MANEINLLPTELKTGKGTIRASRLMTRLALGTAAVFLVSCVIGVGVLVYLGQSASRVHESSENLKNEIRSRESTEQSLVLIKDRLQKLQSVLGSRSAYNTLKKYNDIVASLPPSASLTQVEQSTNGSRITINFTSIADLSAFMDTLGDTDKYNLVRIESLTYATTIGYELVLALE
jgi:Tfp pilus assembly protein PilN